MKTDLVLTMNECLAMCCNIPAHVNPPGKDARHILITAGCGLGMKKDGHSCTCDRWGHPCLGCTEHKQRAGASVQDFSSEDSR
jgi:hypothetical protein